VEVAASTSATVFVAGLVVALYVVPAVICGLKGKPWMLVLGLFFPALLWVGSLRLAKPDSWWARTEYDQDQMGRARVRHGVP
jgi:hypothetical protein